MKIFHWVPEGCAMQPGVNVFLTKGWFRTVFFCGYCKLYFRARWKIKAQWAPRLFLTWSLRAHEEPTAWWREGENGAWVREVDPAEIAENEELRAEAGSTPMVYGSLGEMHKF